jgi:hypothetical protein
VALHKFRNAAVLRCALPILGLITKLPFRKAMFIR